MDWLKKVAVQQAAKDGEMAALICSLVHHKQGATCKMWELLKAIEEKAFGICADFCACCQFTGWEPKKCENDCSICSLYEDGSCCGGEWSYKYLQAFKDDPTPANFRAFQDFEKVVEDYIQAVIDKKKEGEVTYSIGDRFKGIAGTKFMLMVTPNVKIGIVQLDNGDLRGNPSEVKDRRRISVRELATLCMGLELTRYYDARKQQKVGEKSEQGKSELKVKLRHLDYYHDGCNMVLVAKKDDMWLMHYPEWAGTVERGEQGMIDRIGSCGYVRQGNLADDLTETSEGFEMKWSDGATDDYGNIVCKVKDNGIWLHINTDSAVFDLEQIEELHRKLGHVLNGIRSKT